MAKANQDQNSKQYKEMDLKRGVDYIGVMCAFWCHDAENRVLLHKRSKNCRDEHETWDCGGGTMEFGETFEETVRREILEEYGAKSQEIQYILTESVLRDHNGRQTHWIKNLHWVLVDPKEVKINEPHKIDEIGWFTFDNLPEPLHSQIVGEVEVLKKHLGLAE